MEILSLIFIALIACFATGLIAYFYGYDSGYYASYAQWNPSPASDPDLDPEDSGDPDDSVSYDYYGIQDGVVFGRYCRMEHQPWNAQEYAVYPYDQMHFIEAEDCDGPHFFFQYRNDALKYMDIYDQRAEREQRLYNRLNNLPGGYGLPESAKEYLD